MDTILRTMMSSLKQWRKGNPKPLEDNLALILESIHGILNRVAPYFVEARNHYH